MAEVVFHNLEEQLPVLEELEREGVFTRDELRVIIKRRTDFEYKLQKRITEKKDVLNYLEYEMKLDLLRKKRSTRLKLKPYNVASLGISRKIHSLFRKGLMKFQDDLNLWMQYIDFCKTSGSPRAIGLAFGKLLQQHANKPDVWLMAAKHEIEEMNNIPNARLLFQKALRINKSSKQLWHEYFRLELLHVDKIKKRKKVLLDGGVELQNEEEPDPEKIEDFLVNKTAEIVFNNAIKMINDDVDFRTKFITICHEFEDSDKLEDVIYNSLQSDFPDNESVCEALCIRPITKLQRKSFIIKDADWISVENEVESKFKDAVEKKRTPDMYEKYFNCFLKLMKESNCHEQMERRLNVVINILENSEKENCITEMMFLLWTDLLTQMGKEDIALDCLRRGLDIHKKSFTIWQSFLLTNIENGESWEFLSSQFRTCISSVEDDDQPRIWKLFIDACTEVSVEETEQAFEEAIKSRTVKDLYLPEYLKWINKTKGISAARNFYEKHLHGTVDMNFLQSCINIEKLQDKTNVQKLRFLHEKAIADHGESSSDVWLAYVSFEKLYAPEDFDRVGKIYLKAKKTLKGKLNAEFISTYALM